MVRDRKRENSHTSDSYVPTRLGKRIEGEKLIYLVGSESLNTFWRPSLLSMTHHWIGKNMLTNQAFWWAESAAY
jgi:hypothetical protein